MSATKKQLTTFGILLLLIVAPLTRVAAQKTVFESQITETSDITADVLPAAPARIATAKTVYKAGETVVVNGSGFGKGEQVALTVERGGAFQKTSELIAAWTVAADENGGIRAEWLMPFDGEFVVKATGSESGAESLPLMVSSVTPIVVSGNPSCATLNASANPAFAHITTNFGFKLDANPPTGNYPFTNGGIRVLTGGAPAEPANSINYTKINDNAFSFAATRSISAVIIKAGSNANVYPYNPATFGDTNLVTSGTNAISHVEFCYGPAAATITIIKDASPDSPQSFDFKASGQVIQDFSLVDNGVVGPDRIQFTNLTGFGAANTVTITEGVSTPYSLVAINCTSNGSGVENNAINVPARFATIQLEPGENVVCTFVNSITTAANVSAAGRVTDAFGNPISRAVVMIQNASTGETRSVSTGSFGYYRFEDLPSGDTYIISVSHKRYAFSQGTQIFALLDAVENIDFTADPQ